MSIATRLRGMAYKAASAAFRSVTGVSLPDPRLGAFMAGGPSIAGQSVSVDTALQLDPAWAFIACGLIAPAALVPAIAAYGALALLNVRAALGRMGNG